MASSSDTFVLLVGVVAAALYLFREQIFTSGSKTKTPLPAASRSSALADGDNDPRDFIAKMKAGVSILFSICYLNVFRDARPRSVTCTSRQLIRVTSGLSSQDCMPLSGNVPHLVP
jgi:hypothetical protein